MRKIEDFGATDVTMHLKHMDLKFHIDGHKFDKNLMNPSHPIYMFTKELTKNTKYIQASCDALAILPHGLNVLEFCAGMGVLASAAWPLIKPRTWHGIELDQSCVDNWMCDNASISKGDMYDHYWLDNWTQWASWDNTLVIMDWPTNTLRKFWDDPQVSAFMDRLVRNQPKFIHISDIETGWIHMPNHWTHYAGLFEDIGITEKSWANEPQLRASILREGYRHIFAKYVHKRWGYTSIRTTTGGGGDYFLLGLEE